MEGDSRDISVLSAGRGFCEGIVSRATRGLTSPAACELALSRPAALLIARSGGLRSVPVGAAASRVSAVRAHRPARYVRASVYSKDEKNNHAPH